LIINNDVYRPDKSNKNKCIQQTSINLGRIHTEPRHIESLAAVTKQSEICWQHRGYVWWQFDTNKR